MEDLNKALDYFNESLELKKNHNERISNIDTTYNNLGAIFFKQRDFKKSKEFYENSLNVKKKLFGFDSPCLSFTLNNLGLVNEFLNNFKEAIENYEMSLQIKRRYSFYNK